MRKFQEIEEEKFDKGHGILLAIALMATAMWFWQYGQVYKQQVNYDKQISALKSDLDMCKNPEKFFQEEW